MPGSARRASSTFAKSPAASMLPASTSGKDIFHHGNNVTVIGCWDPQTRPRSAATAVKNKCREYPSSQS
ncbi:hypothetical protein IV203_014134 [Nitzschia inconspicua]|uniref:Uncharacterized protein n=1 Tax=Nitzschia inconspicua TaxID=303405 RepID=A0A9K3M6U6_9STRA|nr:hypothetical protein IV203_014134 [Nitzschia inconspicua]